MRYKNIQLSRFTLALTTLLLGSSVYAAAFQFYELGSPINGTAGVGQAAVASDASTAYFNPAGMMDLTQSQLMLAVQPMLTYMNFSPNSSTTISGSNGNNAGGFIPGFGGYYVFHYSPKLSFGASLSSPYGGSLSYDNHWVGRYMVQQMLLYTINFNPSVGYQVNDWLAVGGGFSIEYANLYQTVALRLSPIVDGQATVRVDNVSPGLNLGALLTPNAATKIGLAFRSQIIHDLRGNVSFLNITAQPSASTKLVMPANFIASLSQTFANQFELLGELGWANWSTMTDTIVTVDGYSAVTPDNWHDTYRVGLGGRYPVLASTVLQAGLSYDSSPTSISKRLPQLPMDGQTRVGLGVIYSLAKAVHLGVSYEYIYLGKASINNTSSDGVMAGSYSRDSANIVQASLNVDC